MAEISVIYVNYSDHDRLYESLSSLKATALDLLREVFIVDNNSEVFPSEQIKKHFPGVKLLVNNDNIGYARANNQAIRQAEGKYIFLVNTDTRFFPGAVENLYRELEENSKAGGAGPLLLRRDRTPQVSFGRKISFTAELKQKLFFNFYLKKTLLANPRKRRVGWLSGACLLLRREAVEKVGLLDEKYFLYFEDIDLCSRLRKKEWELIFVPESKVFHLGGGSTSSSSFQSCYQYRKSQLYYYRKHNSFLSVWLLRLYLGGYFFFWLGERVLRGKSSFSDVQLFYKLLR